jgi:hypothetical protein
MDGNSRKLWLMRYAKTSCLFWLQNIKMTQTIYLKEIAEDGGR